MTKARVFIALSSLFMALVFSGAGRGDEPSGLEVSRERMEEAYTPKRLALVVGIDDFEDHRWRSLHYAAKDAEDVASALSDPEVGYFDRVIKLVDPWETRKDAVMTALRQLDNENMSTEDLVFVYISTHGTLGRDENGDLKQYLVAYDTRFDAVPQTGIDLGELTRAFNGLTSRRKVLVLASCHSGMGKSELPDDIMSELDHLKSDFFVKPIEYASEAMIVIGVCSWGETAREDPGLQNDVYTHFFLQGMKTYDRNEDGAVSISEAHDFAQRQTYYFTNGQQRPFARSDVLGTDPIILSGKVNGKGKPVIFSYSEGLAGSRLYLNGAEKGPLPDGYALEPGWNRVRAVYEESGRERVSGRIYVREGERLDLDRVVQARSEPPLGVVAGYRSLASSDLQEDVMPNAGFIGAAYKFGAFPFANTALRLEATYGQTQWDANIEGGDAADVTADAFTANAALLFERGWPGAALFAGPMVGGISLHKRVDNGGRENTNDSFTAYPGAMAGANFKLGRDARLEVSDRLSYNYFNVDDEGASTLSNEIAITVFFEPAAAARLLR